MAAPVDVKFVPLSAGPGATLVVLAGEELAFGPTARSIDERTKGAITKAVRAAAFTGKAKSSIEILAPPGIDAQPHRRDRHWPSGGTLDRLLLGGYASPQVSARKRKT
ncbi:MAG: leucyl aminopeptidase, partial [Rhodospirillales bacterium]|nr:leucyl aminopeptidase [Rhodospirillales bacterium]